MKVVRITKVWRSSTVTRAAVAVTVALLAVQPAITRAGNALSGEDSRPRTIGCGEGVSPWRCLPGGCPDDYVCKPAPSARAVASCCPDTYRAKPCLVLPCSVKRCCPDNYCPKPYPSLCRPTANEWYKCIPLAPCHWQPRATFAGETD